MMGSAAGLTSSFATRSPVLPQIVDRRAEKLVDLIRRLRAAPLARRQLCKRERPIAGFVEAVGDRACLSRHLRMNALRRIAISSGVAV